MTHMRLPRSLQRGSKARRAVLALLLLATAACPGYLAPAPRIEFQVPLETEFILRKDQTVLIAGEALFLTYDEMKGDSRCPRDAQCVQAGEARIEIRVHKSGHRPQMFTLSTVNEPRAARYHAYVVEFVGLEPVPSAGAGSPPEYHALFLVRKRPTTPGG